MISLAWPWLLIFLPLPLFVYWFFKPVHRDEAALNVPFYQRLTTLSESKKTISIALRSRRTLPLILLLLAWLCLVLAASKPQWVGDAVQLPSSGRDLMLAVDISGSMQQTDLELRGETATRLMVVKQVLGEFIERRKGDRIGLLLFGTQAYLQTPLTFDRNTVGTLLNEAQIGFAGEQTAIGDAIGLAVKRLRQRPENSRLLILLTDGANTAGEITPLKAAELAQQQQIKIHTIGVGATEMIQPGFFGSRRINPSADLDETTLKQIAEQTGGQYFRATDTQQLQQIYALLDQLEPVIQDDETFNPVRSLYMWPLALALLLSMILFFLKVDLRAKTFKTADRLTPKQVDKEAFSNE
jgi:Ca-activated chloride channel homolog